MRIGDLPEWAREALNCKRGCTCHRGSWGSVIPPTPCDYCNALKLWRDLNQCPSCPCHRPNYRYQYNPHDFTIWC